MITAFIQGVYYLITGLWPIFHIKSFMLVTGPKVDQWLVKTVGALVAVIGCVLILAAKNNEITSSIIFLGMGSNVAFFIIDAYYSLKGRISKVYLLDCLPQALFFIFWTLK